VRAFIFSVVKLEMSAVPVFCQQGWHEPEVDTAEVELSEVRACRHGSRQIPDQCSWTSSTGKGQRPAAC